MKALEEKIRAEGKIYPGNILKVTSFLNHQIDVDFMMRMGKEVADRFAGERIDKILTVETSGIALAMAAASYLHVPMVFAKKHKSTNMADDNYCAGVHSYTHNQDYTIVVSREYLRKGERVLIVDDFLAVGNAVNGLMQMVREAGGEVAGISVAIEKGFQHGGDALRAQGLHVESLAIVESMGDDSITFRP